LLLPAPSMRKTARSSCLEDTMTQRLDSTIRGSSTTRRLSGTRLVMIRTTRLTRSPKSARQPPVLTQLLYFTVRRSTYFVVMEVSTTNELPLTICTLSTSRRSNGRRSCQTTTRLREEEDTQSSPQTTRSTSMEAGTQRCNSTTS
jgi:hypothetical protein